MQVCNPCRQILAEAVDPSNWIPCPCHTYMKCLSTSQVGDGHMASHSHHYHHRHFHGHLLGLWMGIWLHTHIITIIDTSPDLWELGEILPDASVQTMQLCFGWGCRTFQTASYIHVIHLWGVWAPLRLWMGIWLHTHTVTATAASPDCRKFAEILPDASVQPMWLKFGWGYRTFQLHPMSMSYIYEVFENLLRLVMGIWLHTHTITTTNISPDL